MIIEMLKKWGLLLIMLLGLFCFFYFKLYQYLTFAELKANREWLLSWRNENFILVLFLSEDSSIAPFLYTILGQR